MSMRGTAMITVFSAALAALAALWVFKTFG